MRLKKGILLVVVLAFLMAGCSKSPTGLTQFDEIPVDGVVDTQHESTADVSPSLEVVESTEFIEFPPPQSPPQKQPFGEPSSLGFTLATVGDPASGGYKFVDSKENISDVEAAFGFNITDASNGTNLNLSDDESKTISLPFPFMFYNSTYATISINSNGYVEFEPPSASNRFDNDCPLKGLTVTNREDNAIYVNHIDLDPAMSGSVTHQTIGSSPNKQFIIQWTNVSLFGGTLNVTFQLILKENNDIVMRYVDGFNGSFANGTFATVGLESPNGPNFATLLYGCDTAGLLEDNLTIAFTKNGGFGLDLDNDVFNDTVDCDDGNAGANPGETETGPDGLDNDCNGRVDEGINFTSVEICFAVDTSGSISNAEFALEVQGLIDAIINISRNGTGFNENVSVAVVEFSDIAQVAVNLTPLSNQSNLDDIIDGINNFERREYTTALGDAILACSGNEDGDGVFTTNLSERKIIDLITDGKYNWGTDPVTAATIAKSRKVHQVNALAVGDEVNLEQLQSIVDAGGKGEVFEAADFVEYLEVINDKANKEVESQTKNECASDDVCDDNNQCTDDACESGLCLNAFSGSGQPCDDLDACTAPDVCDGGGSCSGTPIPACTTCLLDSDCDDGNACTFDICAGGACDNPNVGDPACNPNSPPATFCGNNDVEAGETCDGTDDSACPGFCLVNCTCPTCIVDGDCADDGNSCTIETCDAGVCKSTNEVNGTACSDSLTCTSYDACEEGVCVGQEAKLFSCITDANCPAGTCVANNVCKCEECGNNVVEPPEQCDGTDDAACSGQCTSGCECPPPPAVPTHGGGGAGCIKMFTIIKADGTIVRADGPGKALKGIIGKKYYSGDGACDEQITHPAYLPKSYVDVPRDTSNGNNFRIFHPNWGGLSEYIGEIQPDWYLYLPREQGAIFSREEEDGTHYYQEITYQLEIDRVTTAGQFGIYRGYESGNIQNKIDAKLTCFDEGELASREKIDRNTALDPFDLCGTRSNVPRTFKQVDGREIEIPLFVEPEECSYTFIDCDGSEKTVMGDCDPQKYQAYEPGFYEPITGAPEMEGRNNKIFSELKFISENKIDKLEFHGGFPFLSIFEQAIQKGHYFVTRKTFTLLINGTPKELPLLYQEVTDIKQPTFPIEASDYLTVSDSSCFDKEGWNEGKEPVVTDAFATCPERTFRRMCPTEFGVPEPKDHGLMASADLICTIVKDKKGVPQPRVDLNAGWSHTPIHDNDKVNKFTISIADDKGKSLNKDFNVKAGPLGHQTGTYSKFFSAKAKGKVKAMVVVSDTLDPSITDKKEVSVDLAVCAGRCPQCMKPNPEAGGKRCIPLSAADIRKDKTEYAMSVVRGTPDLYAQQTFCCELNDKGDATGEVKKDPCCSRERIKTGLFRYLPVDPVNNGCCGTEEVGWLMLRLHPKWKLPFPKIEKKQFPSGSPNTNTSVCCGVDKKGKNTGWPIEQVRKNKKAGAITQPSACCKDGHPDNTIRVSRQKKVIGQTNPCCETDNGEPTGKLTSGLKSCCSKGTNKFAKGTWLEGRHFEWGFTGKCRRGRTINNFFGVTVSLCTPDIAKCEVAHTDKIVDVSGDVYKMYGWYESTGWGGCLPTWSVLRRGVPLGLLKPQKYRDAVDVCRQSGGGPGPGLKPGPSPGPVPRPKTPGCTVGDKVPFGTDVGICKKGEKVCELDSNTGLTYWKVYPGVMPRAEVCNNLDDDCNGAIDDGIICECTPGETRQCGTGLLPPCRGGTQTCDANHRWGPCVGAVLPTQEICDVIDNNCNGQIDEGFDVDQDGFVTCGGDCNDLDPAINPNANEVCDGLDNNCDGRIDEGFPAPCNAEICNHIDDDGDGLIDEGYDADNDGFAICDNDCDDTDPLINPGATEICDFVDNNCNAQVDEGFDGDGDNYPSCQECDDNNKAIFPGAVELCNNVDDNCNGAIDEGCVTCNDGDKRSCGPSAVGICHPGEQICKNGKWGYCSKAKLPVAEVCNGVDDDCDGSIDELWDADNDGFATCGPTPDCDDSDKTVYPGANEICGDNKDNDCDGLVDEGCPCTSDVECGSNVGVCQKGVQRCVAGKLSSVCEGGVQPSTETCNGLDDDCNGIADDVGGSLDADGDGSKVCHGDCDDNDPYTYSGATEYCDLKDNDCDGQVDEGCKATVTPPINGPDTSWHSGYPRADTPYSSFEPCEGQLINGCCFVETKRSSGPIEFLDADAIIPEGYTSLVDPFSLSCDGDDLDMSFNIIPADEVHTVRCRGGDCTAIEYAIDGELLCAGMPIKELRRSEILTQRPEDLDTVVQTGKVLSGDEEISIGEFAVSFPGAENLRVNIKTPRNVKRPNNPSLFFLNVPVILQLENPQPPVPAELSVPFVLSPDVDKESVAVYVRKANEWIHLGGTVDYDNNVVRLGVENIFDYMDGANEVIVAAIGIQCEACEDSVMLKVAENPENPSAIVLVHGLGSSTATFGPLIDELELAAANVYSFAYPPQYSVDEVAVDLKEAMQRIESEAEEFVILGHSSGGLAAGIALYSSSLDKEKYTYVDKVNAIVFAGTPFKGSPAARLIINWFNLLINEPEVVPIFHLRKEVIDELVTGRSVPRVEGIEYLVITGTKSIEFSLGQFKVRTGELLGLIEKNDGIVTVSSAASPGNELITSICEDRFDVYADHPGVIDDPVARKAIAVLYGQNTLPYPGKPGNNMYVRMRLPDCRPDDVYYVYGKAMPEDYALGIPGCACGDGICQMDESQYICPEDCGRPPRATACTLLMILAYILLACALLSGLTFAIKHVRRHEHDKHLLKMTYLFTIVAFIALVLLIVLCKIFSTFGFLVMLLVALIMVIDAILDAGWLR